jgi:hypothetical protein
MLTHRANGSTGEERYPLPGSSAGRSAAGGQWSMRTSASMIADKVKPRISDQVTCQVIDPGDAQRMQQPVHDVHG